MEDIKEKTCNCDETCDCGCNENKECNCDENCTCGCDQECTCEENTECDCKEEKKPKNKKNKLENKIKELEKQIEDLNNKSLRDKAESINYRKRKDEEVNKMLKYANEDMIMELLPVVDNFERAIKLDDDNLDDELSKFLSGFKMIYCNLISILEKDEVKQIDGNKKPFDPAYHQAVITEKVEGMEKDMVIEVLQKGYLYKDKVIRPAMVKVSE